MTYPIKFRVFGDNRLLDNSEYYLSCDGNLIWMPPCDGSYQSVKRPALEESIFIGAHDADGKEIYDGDIVQFRNDIGIVEYCDIECMWFASCANDHYLLGGIGYKSKIIGNKWENPELMNNEN